jgi:hypothetical protein
LLEERRDIGNSRFRMRADQRSANEVIDTGHRFSGPSMCHDNAPTLTGLMVRKEMTPGGIWNDYVLGVCQPNVIFIGLSGSEPISTD